MPPILAKPCCTRPALYIPPGMSAPGVLRFRGSRDLYVGGPFARLASPFLGGLKSGTQPSCIRLKYARACISRDRKREELFRSPGLVSIISCLRLIQPQAGSHDFSAGIRLMLPRAERSHIVTDIPQPGHVLKSGPKVLPWFDRPQILLNPLV